MPDLPTGPTVTLTVKSPLAGWLKEGPAQAAVFQTYAGEVALALTDLARPIYLSIDGVTRPMVQNADDPRHHGTLLALPKPLLGELAALGGRLHDDVPGCEDRLYWVAEPGATDESVYALVNKAAWAWAVKAAAEQTAPPPPAPPRVEHVATMGYWLASGPKIVQTPADALTIRDKSPRESHNRPGEWFWRRDDGSCGPPGREDLTPGVYAELPTAGRTAVMTDAGEDRERSYYPCVKSAKEALRHAALAWALAEKQKKAAAAPQPPAPPQEYNTAEWLKNGPKWVAAGNVTRDRFRLIGKRPAKVYNESRYYFQGTADSNYGTGCEFFLPNEFFTRLATGQPAGTVRYYDTAEAARADATAAAWEWACVTPVPAEPVPQPVEPAKPTVPPPPPPPATPQAVVTTLAGWHAVGPRFLDTADPVPAPTFTDKEPMKSTMSGNRGYYWSRASAMGAGHVVPEPFHSYLRGRTYPDCPDLHYYDTPEAAKADLAAAALEWARAGKAARPAAPEEPAAVQPSRPAEPAKQSTVWTGTVHGWTQAAPTLAELPAGPGHLDFTGLKPGKSFHPDMGYFLRRLAKGDPRPVEFEVPAEIYDRLTGKAGPENHPSFKYYDTPEAALADLKVVALAWAAEKRPAQPPAKAYDPHWLAGKQIGDRVWAVARNTQTGQAFLAGGCWQVASQTYPGRGPVLLMGGYHSADRPMRPSIVYNQVSWLYCPREDLFPTREAAEACVAQINAAAAAAGK